MTAAIDSMASDSRRVGGAAIFAFTAGLVFFVTGATDIVFLVVFCALIALPVSRENWRFDRHPWPAYALAAFILWSCLSVLWSPVDNKMQAVRFLLGAPFYVLFALRLGGLEGEWRARAEACIIFLAIGAGLFFLYEAVTGGAATLAFKTTVEGMPADSEDTRIRAMYSLGHGALPFIMIAAPAAGLAWREGGPIIGMLIIGLAIVAAFSFETEVNAVGLMAGGVAGAIAWMAPRLMISLVFGLLGGAFIVLPFLQPALIDILPIELRERLPFSWEWRLEIWRLGGEYMQERLLFGWGMDASRPIDGSMELRGFTVDLMPLHPHSTPLQIWMETGMIGAMLAATALILVGGRIASAARLSRLQAACIAWIVAIYALSVGFSYGAWQEWHQACLGFAAAVAFYLGAPQRQASVQGAA